MPTSILSVATIKGYPVYSNEGLEMGEVEDFIFDNQKRIIVYVILCIAGFDENEDRYFAIPRKSLQLDAERDNLILNVTKDELKNALGFNTEQWGFKPLQNFVDSIYELFNYNPQEG